jgi:hypothetical protein
MSKEEELVELSIEEAVIKIFRTCGVNRNPIGYYREVLAHHNNKADFKALKLAGYLKVTNARGTIGYYSAWIELSNKAKNLYTKININYKWDY